jgi:hypothetical protein
MRSQLKKVKKQTGCFKSMHLGKATTCRHGWNDNYLTSSKDRNGRALSIHRVFSRIFHANNSTLDVRFTRI